MSKTVFVLGAGSSVLAKLPSQADILKNIFMKDDVDFTSGYNSTLLKTEERYRQARKNIAEFIVRLFSNKTYLDFINDEGFKKEFQSYSDDEKFETIEQLKRRSDFLENIYSYLSEYKGYIALEDIFTILDKAFVSNEHIQGYDTSKIIQLREDFVLCIIRLFVKSSLSYEFNDDTYINFLRKLMDRRIDSGQQGDPLSIITLNWDFIIDKYFYEITKRDDKYNKLRLDYCVYDHNYHYYFDSKSEENIPSTILKRQGFFNLKLLKLHGAMNWLLCKNCQRLYYSQRDYIAIKEFYDKNYPECPFCKENYHSVGDRNQIKLKSELITPTLLKNLESVTFKNIWKNAFVELSEAERVVFIGYSLPQADFEFRYMLKKAIRPSTKVDVVLYHNDDPNRLRNMLQQREYLEKYFLGSLAETRYKSFFGKDDINFYYEGMADYVNNHL